MKYITKRNITIIVTIIFILSIIIIGRNIYLNKNKSNDMANIKAIKYTEKDKNIIT